MKNSVFLWIPRVVVILIILFLGMFSLDVFQGNASFWEMLGGFFIHNIPSLVLTLILILTWKKPFWAGLFFIAMGIAMTIFFRHYNRWDYFLAIDFPVILIGASFLAYHFLIARKNED